MTSYFSWIPTVSGRLSYSHIGESIWPTRCVCVNQIDSSSSDPNHCQAIFLQTRYCDDFVIPFISRGGGWRGWLRNKIVSRLSGQNKFSGQHYFIGIIDKISDQDELLDKLHGRVYPVLDIGSGKNSSRKAINKIKADIFVIEAEKPREKLCKIIEDVEQKITNSCPVVINFSIVRNGIVELTPEKISHNTPYKMDVNEVVLKDYAEQAFFFLRDISHNHQHHEPDSDTIVRVHKGCTNYRKQIYFDLFRYIVRFKRTRSSKNIMRASGLLAYANSFKSICKDHGDFPNDYQVENLKMSLDAAQFELDYKALQKNSRLSIVLTLSFSFFGALLALTSLSQFANIDIKKLITPDPQIIVITGWVAANPLKVISYSIVLSYFLSLLFGIVRPNRFLWYENMQRLFNHVGKWLYVIPLALLGISLITIGLWFLRQSVL